MDININLDNNNISIDIHKFKKMLFIYNAVEDGWKINKNNNSYIFTKSHEGKKEIFNETYLTNFIKQNLNLKLLSS